ncbi:hypothetical protein HHI36_001808 [Cryptolaemus montrouzieri]|uniref:Uncharacterized protein n=1 Tax=Cryptolaemus montrouzieri TaxID=559131 RepID=A0ABD2P913_9CUCU
MTPTLAPKSGNSGKINLSYPKPSRASSTVKPQKSTTDQSIVNDPEIGKIDPKKNPILMGNGDSSASFTAATRKAWLYVGRVGTDVKEKSVVTYLKNKFPNNNFEVEMLPKRENSNSVALKLEQICHIWKN